LCSCAFRSLPRGVRSKCFTVQLGDRLFQDDLGRCMLAFGGGVKPDRVLPLKAIVVVLTKRSVNLFITSSTVPSHGLKPGSSRPRMSQPSTSPSIAMTGPCPPQAAGVQPLNRSGRRGISPPCTPVMETQSHIDVQQQAVEPSARGRHSSTKSAETS
jgi:hypothetical protein